ncbi:MAG: fumarylacetoacetate hydrolase family protein [Rubrivivax sp.]|nr:MAG: fumarylacetoacetate hydrolase family protein [Rubrivivax sp.]
MKIRRGAAGLEVAQAGQWIAWPALPEAVRAQLAWLQTLAPEPCLPGLPSLPFSPRSFRDGMLFEKHWVQSSRGYARRFMPLAYRAARLVEWISRRPFPAFRPHALAHRQPIYYFGNHLTFVPSGTPVGTPSYAKVLDYELELGLVLSRPLLNATPQQAVAAIGGFVVVNDWTARDVQRPEMQSGMGPQKSKHFLSSMSDTLVTADEVLPRIDALSAWVELNGRTVARTSTQGMLFSLGELLSHLSRDEPLHPGELIATGTLPHGCGMENGHWVKPGDVLRIGIDGVGEIEHRIQ